MALQLDVRRNGDSENLAGALIQNFQWKGALRWFASMLLRNSFIRCFEDTGRQLEAARAITRRCTTVCTPNSASAANRRTVSACAAPSVVSLAEAPTADTLGDVRGDSGIFRADSGESGPTVTSGDISATSFTSQDRPDDIEATIHRCTFTQKWSPEKFKFIKPLQDAVRNKGRVELMESLEHGCMVAVKRMPNSWVTCGPAEFHKERPHETERPWVDIGMVRYLYEQGCDMVPTPFGVFTDAENTYVVSAFATEGDLFTFHDDVLPGPDREKLMRPVVAQLFSAVRCLHELDIAHCDISLENVLLTRQGDAQKVMLVDFGMSCFTPCWKVQGLRGKRSYQAPEMHLCEPGEGYDGRLADVFSVGVSIYLLAVQEYPWFATKPGGCKVFSYVKEKGLRQMMKRKRLHMNGTHVISVMSEPLIELVEAALALKPEDRGSFLGTPALQDARWLHL
eukprot:TRINITY_DN38543_c0_g1_i1.p1 TRINITY_DN38543_c0_g1~~TRINITY_DN38543_c0_g1_i1.p1  ORF type:complete len:453 (-),score=110.35 TRINITY_DN38543_c0_g1_i1:167-1525(-)